ncbi:uncharacterized protein CTHT_0013100 [Thermochaetoides thermophila DSM 1495]|uniref:Exosome complex protein n=1 Tax=Chaetomium thermophilum (strain DSM 1495 / CBS 144.50 / IMI 039719) TaxID=759272 RepID=G0S1C4_CHATD|nr:hypothetical protein CTHT_0013100 [Thermochaetoides thermophila DSM 1495]EGS22834.1 hypothetical protein CTHT_0013100 [Thermochaetoides thermophila DSM 1495]
MDISDITPQLQQLEKDLDHAQDVLKPFLGDLNVISSKLPLLDKAKFFVLVTYTIESLLFSALRLNGVDVKNHPVFTEITRVRQYFEKIKKLEEPPAERETTVNKEAAARVIRADLADNKWIKDRLTELIANERARVAENQAKRPAEEEGESSSAAEGRSDQGSAALPKRPKKNGSKKKK